MNAENACIDPDNVEGRKNERRKTNGINQIESHQTMETKCEERPRSRTPEGERERQTRDES